jgi:hypothetical protein
MKPREAAMYRRRKAATGVRALVTCSIAVERQQAIAKQLEEAIERAREGVSALPARSTAIPNNSSARLTLVR